MSKSPENQINYYLKEFERFDSDKDGYLDRNELFSYLEAVDLFTSPDSLMTILGQLKLKKSKLDKNEVILVVKSLIKARQSVLASGGLTGSLKNLSMKALDWLDGSPQQSQDPSVTRSFFQTAVRRPTNPVKVEPQIILDMEQKLEVSDYEYYSYGSDSEPDEQDERITEDQRPLVPVQLLPAPGRTSKAHPVQRNMPIKSAPMDTEYDASAENVRRKPSSPLPVSSSSAQPWKDNEDNSRPATRELSRAQSKSRSRNRPRSGVDMDKQKDNSKRHGHHHSKLKPGIPKALQDPSVRRQLSKLKDYRPIFLIFVTFVQICMLAYAIFLNQGFESLWVNPFAGPSAVVLTQLGAKYVPCMRPNHDVPNNRIIEWYLSTLPRTMDGKCLYYDNLAFMCGMGGFTQWDVPDQIWRFATPIFIHTGFVHLLFNLIVQLRTGLAMERQMGPLNMFMVYMICGVAGNLFSAILAPDQVSVGASGSLYGLFSLLYMDLLLNWPVLVSPWRDLIVLSVQVILALGIGLLPYVDNYAHIGGFLAGILCGLVFLPTIKFSRRDRIVKLLLKLVAFPLLLSILGYGFYVFWMQYDVECGWCKYLDCVPPGEFWCSTM